MRIRILTLVVLAVSVTACGKGSTPVPTDTTGGSTVIAIMSLDSSGSSAGDYDANGKLNGAGYGAAFSPKTATVSVGSTVTWRNDDAVVHQPTSDTGAFGSRIDPNGKYNYQFTAAGTYTYHCNIHPEIAGTITVK